ncbi:MAG TPA: metallophosphoesterase family protein [Actinomycetota bacterium]|nr:metallophosphoesterase family protein [Actinomycetota bacterium]
MRVAVCSDIHSNIEAFDAVLARAGEEGAEAVWILGDIVGYGADPVAVVDRVRSLPAAVVLGGNHDLAATDRFDVRWFNRIAARAIEWTKTVLDDTTREFLTALQPAGSKGGVILVHGSVVDPAIEYVTNERVAEESFAAASFACCFFGHTHLPTIFTAVADGSVRGAVLGEGESVELRGDRRYMVNPGSVGQPRDGDARASFAMYDTAANRVVLHRVAYDVDAAAGKIRGAGLPDTLADRLAVGR